MKKLLIVFTIFVYFVPVAVFLAVFMSSLQEGRDDTNFGSFMLPVIMMLIVCVLIVVNIVSAIISAMHLKYLSFRSVMVFKLCLIPFYIVNFVCWGIASAVFHIALFIWPLIPFIIAYTYFTVIGTSVYNIAHLLILCRSKKISTKQCVVHCILQLVFTADVIGGIYLAAKNKKLGAELAQKP